MYVKNATISQRGRQLEMVFENTGRQTTVEASAAFWYTWAIETQQKALRAMSEAELLAVNAHRPGCAHEGMRRLPEHDCRDHFECKR